jgi:hypothetical protein
MVGLDLVGRHWHADHPRPLNNPGPFLFEKWARTFDTAAVALRERNITVVNCSPISALTCWPKVALEEWCRCR